MNKKIKSILHEIAKIVAMYLFYIPLAWFLFGFTFMCGKSNPLYMSSAQKALCPILNSWFWFPATLIIFAAPLIIWGILKKKKKSTWKRVGIAVLVAAILILFFWSNV